MDETSHSLHISPRLIAMIFAAVLAISALTALGVWQVERRAWKLELIEQIDRNVHAVPVAAPGPSDWAALTARDAYRRVVVHGVF